VKDADVVYTDTWIDMELFLDPKFKEEKEKRIKQMLPYQINSQLVEGSQALVMHDMPIHRGYEIDAAMVEAPNSVIFDQAENRLHSEKAILLKLLDKV
jgi:ornithine carbamoyltransferase